MNKFFRIALAAVLTISLAAFAGCAKEEKEIMVISRESGSGTRSAFEELLGIEASDVYYDLISDKTNNVVTAVANNSQAIGYISLGSLTDTVKALSIDGTEATAQNVRNGTYLIARPFILIHKEGSQLSTIAADFKTFLTSTQAQAIISEKGYVATVENAVVYTPTAGMSGTLSLNGSTSVSPLMISLVAKYVELNPGVSDSDITISQTGSGTGISTTINGGCDFGMSSRELKSTETGLVKLTICNDGIAVIVNKENSITNITKENLVKIYKGEIRKFSEIA